MNRESTQAESVRPPVARETKSDSFLNAFSSSRFSKIGNYLSVNARRVRCVGYIDALLIHGMLFPGQKYPRSVIFLICLPASSCECMAAVDRLGIRYSLPTNAAYRRIAYRVIFNYSFFDFLIEI